MCQHISKEVKCLGSEEGSLYLVMGSVVVTYNIDTHTRKYYHSMYVIWTTFEMDTHIDVVIHGTCIIPLT